MQEAFAYCAELVRTADRDRFLSSLFAPAQHRGALHALYAFNVEVARVREVAREPLPGEIRLQWWSEVLRGERAEEASANPVASALLTVIGHYQLASTKLAALIDARCFDLYDDPIARLTDLEAYASKTSSALIALAAHILSGGEGEVTETVANPAGIAYAIAGLIRAFPLHAARRQLYVPLEAARASWSRAAGHIRRPIFEKSSRSIGGVAGGRPPPPSCGPPTDGSAA